MHIPELPLDADRRRRVFVQLGGTDVAETVARMRSSSTASRRAELHVSTLPLASSRCSVLQR